MDMIESPPDDDRRAASFLPDADLISIELGTNRRGERGISVFRAVNEVNEIHRQ